MFDKNKFSNAVKTEVKKAGGVRELAREMGVSAPTISRWSEGSVIPDLFSLSIFLERGYKFSDFLTK